MLEEFRRRKQDKTLYLDSDVRTLFLIYFFDKIFPGWNIIHYLGRRCRPRKHKKKKK